MQPLHGAAAPLPPTDAPPQPTDPGGGARACPNCGGIASGRYCPDCGQAQGPLRATVREMGRDFVEEHLGWDSKIMRTIGLLLARPGGLTREYLAGRRTRYLRPLRLYLLTSLLFFFAFTAASRITSTSGDGDPDDGGEKTPAADTRTPVAATGAGDGLRIGLSRRRGVGAEGMLRIDTTADASADASADTSADTATGRERSTIAPVRIGGRADSSTKGGKSGGRARRDSSWIERRFKAQSVKIAELPEKERAPTVIAKTLEQMPKALFLLVPAVALLLRILYVRSDVLLAEHLVFALHTQSAMFLLALAMTGMALTPLLDDLQWIPLLYAGAYVFLAMRRMYGQSRTRTAVKFVVLVSAYSLALLVAMILMAIVALLIY